MIASGRPSVHTWVSCLIGKATIQLKDQQLQVTPRSVYDDHRNLRHDLPATSRQRLSDGNPWLPSGLRSLLYHDATTTLSSRANRPQAGRVLHCSMRVGSFHGQSTTAPISLSNHGVCRHVKQIAPGRPLTKARDARDRAAQSAARHGR